MLSPLPSFVGYPLVLGQESRNVSNDSTSAPLLKSEEKLPTWYFDLDLHITPRNDQDLYNPAGTTISFGLGLKLELRLSRFASLLAGCGPGTMVPFLPGLSSYQGSIRIYPLKPKKAYVGFGLFTRRDEFSHQMSSLVPFNGHVFSLRWRQNCGIGFETGYRFGDGPRSFSWNFYHTESVPYYVREWYLTVTLTFFSH